MVKYLVGRVSDPLVGVFTGLFAYYIYETDPRNAAQRPEGRRLWDLLSRWSRDEKPDKSLYEEVKHVHKV
ncbi:Non-classical export protein 1 [Ceraceosorus bombacis]|uniref:Non-classical export protein 1 n=1 Tax=Ceraceosorus bombacis TaxID=401625 RepID=A0A0P1BQK0_9BASI|nr:Non-classical export protein 1 [Ceraceosorus bombacis]